MMQQIDIPVGTGAEAYVVTLIGENLRHAFAKAGFKDKEGEALVRTIVAQGGIAKIIRSKGGQFNDGPHGEPGLVQFNSNGTPRAIRHFKNGGLNDTDSEIAVQQFDHSGKRLVYARSFRNGKSIKRLTEQELRAYPTRFYRKAQSLRKINL